MRKVIITITVIALIVSILSTGLIVLLDSQAAVPVAVVSGE